MTTTLTRPAPTGPPPSTDTPLAPTHRQGLVEQLKALADPTRLHLLQALRAVPDQQACVSDLTTSTGLAQPMVSHHLQILRRADLVTATRRGSRVFYRLNRTTLNAVARDLAQP